MSIDTTVSPLRQRMIEDMAARKLGRHAQRSHIHSCRRFAAFLGRSPDTATADDVRRFQLHLVESGLSICNRNRIMTGVRFLFRVTLRRHDLAAEVYHLKEPQKLPLVMSPEEAKRLLAMSGNLKVHVMLALAYGCGLRELDPEKETGGHGGALPLESADSAGAGHEADTEEAQCGVQGEGGGGGNQGRPDRRRVGGAIRGAPEPDPQLEEATAGWCGEPLRGRRAGGGSTNEA